MKIELIITLLSLIIRKEIHVNWLRKKQIYMIRWMKIKINDYLIYYLFKNLICKVNPTSNYIFRSTI